MEKSGAKPKKRGRPAANQQIDKARILQIAVEEFANHGFDGTMLKEIARKAGIANSLMNYHFESKENLWQQAVSQLGEKLKDRFKEIHTYLKDIQGMAAVKAYTRQYIYFCAEHPEFYKIFFHEMCTKTERADWLIANLLTPMYTLFERNSATTNSPELQIGGYPVANISSIITGAANVFFVHAYQMEKLYGVDPFDKEQIEKHADIVMELIFEKIK